MLRLPPSGPPREQASRSGRVARTAIAFKTIRAGAVIFPAMRVTDQISALAESGLGAREHARFWRAERYDGLECLAARFVSHRCHLGGARAVQRSSAAALSILRPSALLHTRAKARCYGTTRS